MLLWVDRVDGSLGFGEVGRGERSGEVLRSGEVGHEEREDLSLGAAQHRTDTVRAVERALEQRGAEARVPASRPGTTSRVAKEATQCGGISGGHSSSISASPKAGLPSPVWAVAQRGPPGSVSSVNSWPKTPSWKFWTRS